jgi:hypothetical protein
MIRRYESPDGGLRLRLQPALRAEGLLPQETLDLKLYQKLNTCRSEDRKRLCGCNHMAATRDPHGLSRRAPEKLPA